MLLILMRREFPAFLPAFLPALRTPQRAGFGAEAGARARGRAVADLGGCLRGGGGAAGALRKALAGRRAASVRLRASWGRCGLASG